MIFLIPMMMAFLLALAVMAVIGFAVVDEHNLVAVFHEEHHDHPRR